MAGNIIFHLIQKYCDNHCKLQLDEIVKVGNQGWLSRLVVTIGCHDWLSKLVVMIGCQDFCQIVVFASLSAPSVSIFGCFNLCSEHLCVFSCSTVNLINLADQILPISNEACSSYLHWAVAVHIGSNIWISLGWLFSNYHKKGNEKYWM